MKVVRKNSYKKHEHVFFQLCGAPLGGTKTKIREIVGERQAESLCVLARATTTTTRILFDNRMMS